MSNEVSKSLPELVIRPAQKHDAKLILTFIEELADFEKLRHEVVATESSIAEQLFGSNPSAEALIGEADGSAAGFALFHETFSSFLGQAGMYLVDLYVRPEYRSCGFGRSFLKELAQIAKARNYGRIEWAVLNWNEPAISFYRSLGTEEQNEWTVHRLSGKNIETLATS